MPPRYTVSCGDFEITVLKNVYAPRFFTDSVWFLDVVPVILKGTSFLEIGCGTGIISIACAMQGANVVATDINPDAVKNTRINAENHNLEIDVREGDVYGPLRSSERFNFIFWAHPFNNSPEPVNDILLRSGFDYQYEGLKKYIAGARDHLTPKGRLLLGTGDSADIGTITSVAAEHGYTPVVLEAINMPLEEGGDIMIRYLLLDLTR